MSNYRFYLMTKNIATQISTWKYEDPYSFYNMDESDECISELLSDEYYYVTNDQNALIGFLCSGNSARVSGGYKAGLYNDNEILDIGLGMTPEITGLGKGQEFLINSILFLKENFKVQKFQLVVAEFNERAIKVYERAGFMKGMNFKSKVKTQEVDFIVMNYTNHE
ncbi:GNAT family N-acetyltransferase [Paenibacillus sp. J5C_2022]|uniref:GNAT family N-acetyltransferase n=1 Tax=Paenibacillus sp. J5C2022 TaxID=2977129 RepID=UPI0021CF9745|nr:GNAT family protein [Paenibacillus sp. J5C2022]MCU6713189.1 GNAT family N-acetyltransferase [Paenibacillus sp. J5C2022]